MKTRGHTSEDRRLDEVLPASIGVCVKDSNRRVQFQNSKCVEVCGNQIGQICQKSCMQNYRNESEAAAVGPGTCLELGVSADDGSGNIQLIDAVVIDDGCSITTIFSPISKSLQKARSALKNVKLSPAQVRVFDLVLLGRSNREIAAELFISVPTVRTHLTRIYEKIPMQVLQRVLAGSSRRPLSKP